MTSGADREQRYRNKVNERGSADCWPWIAAHNVHGYGLFRGGAGEQLAHRYGWRITFGDIPRGMVVCHTCDNPECQNPSHWFLGTPRDNNDDKMRKGRHVPGRSSGPMNGNAVLSEAAVGDIVRLYLEGHTQTDIGVRFGVNARTVGKIVRGERWGHLTGGESVSDPTRRPTGASHHNAKITQEIADDIRRRYASGGVTQQALANEYDIAQRTVSQIVRGLAWVK